MFAWTLIYKFLVLGLYFFQSTIIHTFATTTILEVLNIKTLKS